MNKPPITELIYDLGNSNSNLYDAVPSRVDLPSGELPQVRVGTKNPPKKFDKKTINFFIPGCLPTLSQVLVLYIIHQQRTVTSSAPPPTKIWNSFKILVFNNQHSSVI